MDSTKNKSLARKGIIGFLWNFSGSIVQIVLQLTVIGILSRLLTPREFGIVAIILIVVNFTNLFVNMGIGSALIQLPKITPHHESLAFTLSIGMGILFGGIYYLVAPLAAAFFEIEDAQDALKFFAIFFPLGSFRAISGALINRKLRFDISVKSGLISYILGSGLVAIVLAYLGYSYWALIIGQLVALITGMCYLFYFEPPRLSFRFDKKIVKELLFYGSGHTLGTIFNYFAENTDNIIVGRSLGSVALGVYSKAFQLLAIPSKFFGSMFDKVLFPILSKRQKDTKKLSDFYLFSISVCFGLLMPISIMILINAELIVYTLLGDQWGEVILPLRLLIFGLAFRFGTKINKSYLKSLGIVYRGAYYQFIFASLMLVCCYIGSKLYGLPGVAIGVFVATVINYFQVAYRLYRHLSFSGNRFLGILGRSTLFHLLFVGVTVLLYSFGFTSKWLHLGLSILIYLPIILWFLFSSQSVIFSKQNFTMISMVLNSLPTKFGNNLQRIPVLKKYYD